MGTDKRTRDERTPSRLSVSRRPLAVIGRVADGATAIRPDKRRRSSVPAKCWRVCETGSRTFPATRCGAAMEAIGPHGKGEQWRKSYCSASDLASLPQKSRPRDL